jgi:hypothetical protein
VDKPFDRMLKQLSAEAPIIASCGCAGKAEGKAECRAEGKAEEARQLAKLLLAEKFPGLDAAP